MSHFKKIFTCIVSFALIVSGCERDNIDMSLRPPSAEAGNPVTISLPVSNSTLTGTGISYNGPITGYLWSLISGPTVPVIESPSSASTRISSMVEGTYKFQFAVMDSAGLTGIDTTSITVLADPILTLTLQPAHNPTEASIAWSTSGNQTGTNFNLQEIPVFAWTHTGELFLGREVLKFDLSSIPASAEIISAKLSLYSVPNPLNGNQTTANFGSSNAMFIERILTNWNAGLTWANQPSGDIASQILIPHTNASFLDLVDVDVKSLVAPMVSGNSNYGFKLRLQNEAIYNIRNFCSSWHTDASKHPKLVVSYRL